MCALREPHLISSPNSWQSANNMNNSQLPIVEEWRRVINEQRPSGLTVAAYCQERGITVSPNSLDNTDE
jgi:hypothetical protein